MRRHPSWTWSLLLCLLGGCLVGPIDCTVRPSGACDPHAATPGCPQGFFCARTETCTRACTYHADCRTPCGPDETGVVHTCAPGRSCVDGFCSPADAVRCDDGFCQAVCAARLPDGRCDYDVYGPSNYGAER